MCGPWNKEAFEEAMGHKLMSLIPPPPAPQPSLLLMTEMRRHDGATFLNDPFFFRLALWCNLALLSKKMNPDALP